MSDLLIAVNPIVSILLIIPAIFYVQKSKNNVVTQVLSTAIGLSFLLLLYKNGKSYYFFPIILTILPFGGLFWEGIVLIKRKWMIYPVIGLMLLGVVLIPFGMPVYSFNRYLKNVYPHDKMEIRGGEFGVKYDEYYTQDKWETTLLALKSAYDSLSNDQKKDCLIWGKHYSQAGAVNLFGESYNLPNAFSFHGSFYSWTPKGRMPNTIIALSYQVGDFFNLYFEEVTMVKSIYNPYSDNEEELYQQIYICNNPKQDFEKVKELFRKRIFE